MYQKLAPDPFLILLNDPKQPLHARNYFLKDILKEDYQKAWKKLTLFFLLNLFSFNRQNYQKQKWYGTSDQSLFKLQKKFKNIPLFVIYYPAKFDGVMQSIFWVIPKFTFANLCKPVHDIIIYSTSICPFESRKGRKEGKKSQKFEYLENKKSFLDEIKNISHSF